MKLEVEIPDDLALVSIGPVSSRYGGVLVRQWQAYLRPLNGPIGYLQGRVAATPQGAIDDCAAAIRKADLRIEAAPPRLNLKLDLTRLKK